MIRRTFDPHEVNALGNRADVHPHHAGQLDFSPAMESPENVFLMVEGGCVIMVHDGDGVFHGHVMFEPLSRGAVAVGQTRAAIAHMFEEHRAAAVIGEPLVGNRPARLFARQVGMTAIGFDEGPLGAVERLIVKGVTCRH